MKLLAMVLMVSAMLETLSVSDGAAVVTTLLKVMVY